MRHRVESVWSHCCWCWFNSPLDRMCVRGILNWSKAPEKLHEKQIPNYKHVHFVHRQHMRLFFCDGLFAKPSFSLFVLLDPVYKLESVYGSRKFRGESTIHFILHGGCIPFSFNSFVDPDFSPHKDRKTEENLFNIYCIGTNHQPLQQRMLSSSSWLNLSRSKYKEEGHLWRSMNAEYGMCYGLICCLRKVHLTNLCVLSYCSVHLYCLLEKTCTWVNVIYQEK